MIKKFNEYIKESLLDKLQGPSKKEIWESFGYDKPFDTPEEFFLDIIDGIKVKEQTKYPNSILWSKNNKTELLQDIRIKYLYVDNDIWKIFEKVFDMKYEDIKELIKEICKEKLDIINYNIVIGEINKM